jgi:hypothetical protein|uniref:Uncharacterized protein n=1 Tax=viral metagenome TaxID=1070528 RepID=A0A6C0IU68_9ZZZZ
MVTDAKNVCTYEIEIYTRLRELQDRTREVYTELCKIRDEHTDVRVIKLLTAPMFSDEDETIVGFVTKSIDECSDERVVGLITESADGCSDAHIDETKK